MDPNWHEPLAFKSVGVWPSSSNNISGLFLVAKYLFIYVCIYKRDISFGPTLAISKLLPTRFGWNFQGRLLGKFRTDYNKHGDICPGNICPYNICQYHEYLSFNWPNFDHTLKNRLLGQMPTLSVILVQAKYVLATFVHIINILAVNDSILTKLQR